MGDSHTAFIGSIPEHYDLYLGPLIFEEYAIDLARRLSVPAGGTVLETAAGTGIVTRHLRKILPQDVKIVITDLNESMLEYAKHKFNTHDNLEFQPADASNLSFPPAFFDAVVCQFSLMFFPDKQAAIEEVVRVLKPSRIEVEEVVDIVEDAIRERYGRSSIQAQMQSIIFKAYRPIEA